MMHTEGPPPVVALASLSARLGRDLRLIQGAGGNTSVKVDDQLWVKASGTRLADALDRPIFAVLPLCAVQRELEAAADGASLTTTPIEVAGAAAGLRPSIETAFHAALPERYVVHTHSIAVAAHACRTDGEAVIGEKLAGLEWVWVPFVRPGIGLARAMLAARRPTGTRIYILGNHGAVYTGDDLEAIEATIREVERRLASPRLTTAGPTDPKVLDRHADRFDMVPADTADWHHMAVDPQAFRVATAGTLYPDHAIFLGDGCWWAEPEGDPVRPSILAKSPMPCLLLRGIGCLIAQDLSDAQTAMLHCLAGVCRQVPANATVRPLDQADVAALLNWDAERYRQKLEAERHDDRPAIPRA